MILKSLAVFQIFVIFVSAERNFIIPNISTPIHYDVNIEVQLGPKFGFNGSVKIEIFVPEPTDILILQSRYLQLDTKRLTVRQKDKFYEIQSTSLDTEIDFFTIKFKNILKNGYYEIFLPYYSDYNKMPIGLFTLDSIGVDGRPKKVAVTRFQPVSARDMFPCYDEPYLKATFNLSVTHPMDYHTISNTIVLNVTHDFVNKKTTTRFERTPKMSSYLLALAVTDFQSYQTFAPDTKIKVRVYTEARYLELTKLALNVSAHSVSELQKMLRVDYPLTKLDSVAINDHPGGMENWGMIAYDMSIIGNETNHPLRYWSFKEAVDLICHEITHHWFGDLVTLQYWDYVWLNEGFAVYYSKLIADKIFPHLRADYEHTAVSLVQQKNSDAFPNAESLNKPIDSLNTAMLKFNQVGYEKGAAIIRFMRIFFTEFDKGITEYLKKNSYGNVNPDDLFSAIASQNNDLPKDFTVSRIMTNWVEYGGLPLVTVNTTTHKNGSTSIFVTQKSLRVDHVEEPYKFWYIPITLATQEDPNFENLKPVHWLTDRFIQTRLTLDNSQGWIIANLQSSVYCRVNYDTENWRKIITYLKGPDFRKIHVLNRAQLIADSVYLFQLKVLDSTIPMDLLTYLKQEDDPIPHMLSTRGIALFSEYLKQTPAYPKFESFVKDIYGENKANEILDKPNLRTMVSHAFEASRKKYKHSDTSFDRLVERIHSLEDHKEVQQILEALNSRTENKNQMKTEKNLSSKIASIAKFNIRAKREFLSSEYEKVEKWLDENY